MILNGPKRAQHFAAMLLIGDGVMAMVRPRRDARAWRKGPTAWRAAMEFLAERPTLTRTIGAVQVAAGVVWALQQKYEE